MCQVRYSTTQHDEFVETSFNLTKPPLSIQVLFRMVGSKSCHRIVSIGWCIPSWLVQVIAARGVDRWITNKVQATRYAACGLCSGCPPGNWNNQESVCSALACEVLHSPHRRPMDVFVSVCVLIINDLTHDCSVPVPQLSVNYNSSSYGFFPAEIGNIFLLMSDLRCIRLRNP